MNRAIIKFFAYGLIMMIFFACNAKKQQPQMQKSIPEVGVFPVKQEVISLTTLLPGRIAPFRIAEVRPQVGGIIKKRYFVEGGDVKAGDILYQIDPSTFEATLANAKASLARAEANLPAIKQRVERYKELLPSKAVSQQDYDDATAQLKQAEADVQYWQAAVRNAEINLSYTKVKAPISGKIGKSNVTEGALVTANQPSPLATIQQINPVYVDVTQSTGELLRLKKNFESGVLNQDYEKQKRVTLILEDGTKYPIKGRLQFKDITVDPTTGSVTLRVLFDNVSNLLLPGMFVRAEIMEGVNKRAILIPQEVVMRDPKGNPFVYVITKDDVIEQRTIVIDRAVGNKWLLLSGLNNGEKIVLDGIQKVKHGDKVKVVNG